MPFFLPHILVCMECADSIDAVYTLRILLVCVCKIPVYDMRTYHTDALTQHQYATLALPFHP